MQNLQTQLRTQMDSMPVVDVHTHIGGRGLRQARTLADIVSYHWLHLELYRAGADAPDTLAASNPDLYMEKVAPFFKDIRNTSNHYVMITMLRDLYGFKDRTITEDNWKALDKEVRKRAGSTAWISEVLDRAKVKKLTVAFKDGMPTKEDRYIPYEYGEYLFSPTTGARIAELTEKSGIKPTNKDELKQAIDKQIASLKKEHNVGALHVWPRDNWQYRRCHEEDVNLLMIKVKVNRALTQEEDDRLISYAADCTAEAAAKHGMTIQLFHGMDFYSERAPVAIASYWDPGFLRSIPKFASSHPNTQLDIFLATRIPSHESASIARMNRNISLSGAWWHGFTPSTLVTFFKDRLELLPHTSWNAFFSDGYIAEWIYAKLLLTKNCLSCALATQVEQGYLTADDALDVAQKLLHDNAYRIYGLK
ncbi:MAG: hypothetical protein GF350_06205 [Chitinivibrionales bacterium]|nr:hypothetical protein [Chitinivibrionales bacterium]